MMMGIIIKDLSNKLEKHLAEKNGKIFIGADWVNDWLSKNNAPFKVTITDASGNELENAQLSIFTQPKD
jgi:hypothetical protein